MRDQNEYIIIIKSIRYYRKKANITQEQLAEKAGISVSYIKQIESGKEFKNMTFTTLSNIAKSLNVNIKDLLSEKDTVCV